MSGISDLIRKHILNLEGIKAEQKEACNKAAEHRDATYTDLGISRVGYNTIEGLKNSIKNKIKLLQDKLQSEIRSAIRKGVPTFDIEQRYGKEIAALNAQLELVTNQLYNKDISLREAENDYFNAKINGYSKDGDFISTCHELSGEYLYLGNVEQREIVNEYMTKPIDFNA